MALGTPLYKPVRDCVVHIDATLPCPRVAIPSRLLPLLSRNQILRNAKVPRHAVRVIVDMLLDGKTSSSGDYGGPNFMIWQAVIRLPAHRLSGWLLISTIASRKVRLPL